MSITIRARYGAMLSGGVALLLAASAHAETASVNLASAYNVRGAASDGVAFSGGLDGGGAAYSANHLGTSITVGGVPFTLGAAGGNNAVASTTVALPAGSFTRLDVLAAAVNGNQPSRAFVVIYTDGTSTTFTQSVSDWFTPQGYTGEVLARATSHRNRSDGSAENGTFDLYAYTFPLASGKTAKSLTLPASRNVVVLAATLSGATGGAPIVQLYQHCSFGGWAASFTAAGSYGTADLIGRGAADNEVSSIKVGAGTKVTLYDGDGQSGTSLALTAGDTACLVGNGFNDKVSSIKIEADTGGDVDDSVVACGSAPAATPAATCPTSASTSRRG
jgi:hypothetical protein